MKLLLPISLTLMSNLLFAHINCTDTENIDRENIETCFIQEDKALNNVYKNLMKSHKQKAEAQKLLQKAQRAWMVTRDAHCTLVGRATVIGAGVNMAICEVKMTQNRTKELQELFDMNTPEPEVLSITKDSFNGIKVGSQIVLHKTLKKDVLRSGEGEFNIYTIHNENDEKVGYLFPNPKNIKLVGDIVITTKNASTKDGGTYVGITFETLKDIFLPRLEVHGSEIEGRTYASANGIMYRLDTHNFNYDINIEKIPNTAKVTEILLQHK